MTLKSSEIKNFLSWRISTILRSFLVASASCHSTLPFFIRPVESTQMRTEDNLLISKNSIAPSSSRGNWPWRRRVLNRFDTGLAIFDWVPGSMSVHILSQIGTVLVDEQEEVRLRGFALAFDLFAIASTFVFNANSSNFISEVSCSLPSSSLLLKSVTNLFNPWEIQTHEW